jgi:hypothetical protein
MAKRNLREMYQRVIGQPALVLPKGYAAFGGELTKIAQSKHFTVTVGSATLDLMLLTTSILIGQSMTMRASLSTPSGVLVGRTVIFLANGTEIGRGTTNASGIVDFIWTPTIPGTYEVWAEAYQ